MKFNLFSSVLLLICIFSYSSTSFKGLCLSYMFFFSYRFCLFILIYNVDSNQWQEKNHKAFSRNKTNREKSSITMRLITKKTCSKTASPREQGLDPNSDGSFNNDVF